LVLAVNLINLKNQAVLVYILHVLVGIGNFLVCPYQCEVVTRDALSSVSAKEVGRRGRDELFLIVIN
jgi:hypothetical protein